jgi:hypothetical protein|tara:strand:+ start:901 stop:1359 length:459 start_codon:yes stop_codon:yes gene_type:complete
MTVTKYSSASKFSTKDAYKWYKKNNPDTTVTYSLYKHIISQFNKKVADAMLDGEVFNMGYKLGTMRIKRIPRTFNKPSIDWGETNRLKKQGIKKLVYYTDDYYFRWNWDKARCMVKNKSVYTFAPTAGPNGNKRKLVKRLKSDEFAYLNYKT